MRLVSSPMLLRTLQPAALCAGLAISSVGALGCDERRATRDAGDGRDAGSANASDMDAPDAARPDSGRRDTDLNPDAALDASAPRDAGMDAPSAMDAARPDAAVLDAPTPTRDAPSAGSDTGPRGTVIECAPIVPSGASAGLVFSRMFWPGFRFEVTASTRARRVGLQIAPDRTGVVQAALVRLTGPSDGPDVADLSGADVVARADLAMPASATALVLGVDVDVALTPGWYALVFGTTDVGGSLPSAGGRGCISSPGSSFPFSIRQSDGVLILQGAEPHLFVELSP
jgi:hypothetical protein